MKIRPLLYISLLILTVISLVGINIYASQNPLTLQSEGVITYPSVTFILRHEWIGAMKTASDVDRYVAEHPWGNAIILTDGSDGILSVISYAGYATDKKWVEGGSFTYAQLKEVIDRFHHHDWKVIYSAANTPTKTGNSWIWNYINNVHRELAFTDGNGKKVGLEGVDGNPSKKLIPNFFAKYTTADLERNISVGERLIDVYTRRLKQMIIDGAFEWDGWFGVDGWNGFTGGWSGSLWWLATTDQPWGRWIGTSDNSNWVDGSYQAIDEWASSSYVPVGFPPANWAAWSNVERAAWIRSNANLEWWEYWMDRFARMYAQIRQVFVDTRPPDWYVGTILSQDTSSTWADNGINNPAGMENLTAFARYGSFDHYYIDCEWADELTLLARRQAYVAGLVKSKVPEAHCIVGLQLESWKRIIPTWTWKQEYLAQVQTWVWKNGSRFRAVDPTWVLVWTPSNKTWNDSAYHGQEMANWVKKMVSILDQNIEPVWLGPVDVLPIYHSGTGIGYASVNFTFAQFTDVLNIKNHPEYITSEWGTIFLDAVRSPGTGVMTGTKNRILSLFSSGNLNLIYHGYGFDAQFTNTLVGEGDAEYMVNFHLSNPGIGSSTLVFVLNKSDILDPYAQWIAGGYYGNQCSLDETGALSYLDGFVPIITYDDGYLELGLFYNVTSGRFFYGRSWSSTSWSPVVRIPRAIINRGIYWASKCPANISEPLLDLKIFKLGDGSIFMTMMNLKNCPDRWDLKAPDISCVLKLDPSFLGLLDPADYDVYWQSDLKREVVSDWNNVSIMLRDGADILVVRPRNS